MPPATPRPPPSPPPSRAALNTTKRGYPERAPVPTPQRPASRGITDASVPSRSVFMVGTKGFAHGSHHKQRSSTGWEGRTAIVRGPRPDGPDIRGPDGGRGRSP